MASVYTAAKILHFPDKVRDIRDHVHSPPVHVRLKPTNRCDHGCRYCCYRNPALPPAGGMRTADEIPLPKLLELAADFRAMGVRAVTLSGGGDPLCHPRIGEALEALAAAGVRLGILTNGSRLDGDTAAWLARNADWVRVSMDAADADTYGRTRRVPPQEFGKVCANIVRFAALAGRRCAIGVNFVATRENRDQVLPALRLVRELGAAHAKVSLAVVSPEAGENAAYAAAFLDSVRAQIAQARAELESDAFRIVDKTEDPDVARARYEKAYHTCPSIQALTVIGADQHVYACQDKAYSRDGLVGSIRGQSFRDLWAAPATRHLLSALDPSRHCRHHCASHERNLVLFDYLATDAANVEFV